MADNGSHWDTRIARMREMISLYPQNASFRRQLINLLIQPRQRDQRQRDQAHGQARIKTHTSLAPPQTSSQAPLHTSSLATPQTSKGNIPFMRDPLSAAVARRVDAEAIVATHTRMLEQYKRQTTEATLSSNFEVCQPPIKDNADINVDVASERAVRSHYTPNANAGQSQF